VALSKPCRLELMTTDADGAARFYEQVFGWQAEAEDLSGEARYLWLRDGRGRAVGGLYDMTEDLRRQGVAAHWRPQFAVADADAAARQARALGGRISLDAFDLLGRGRLALIQDPAGAPLGLWQAASGNHGAAASGDAPFWPELSVLDTTAAARFYQDLFGWQAVCDDAGDRSYTTLRAGDETIGGMLAIGARFAGIPAHWLAYVTVDDDRATLARVHYPGAAA
jgi:predicted enzyme related to lactoylglutathione lyase